MDNNEFSMANPAFAVGYLTAQLEQARRERDEALAKVQAPVSTGSLRSEKIPDALPVKRGRGRPRKTPVSLQEPGCDAIPREDLRRVEQALEAVCGSRTFIPAQTIAAEARIDLEKAVTCLRFLEGTGDYEVKSPRQFPGQILVRKAGRPLEVIRAVLKEFAGDTAVSEDQFLEYIEHNCPSIQRLYPSQVWPYRVRKVLERMADGSSDPPSGVVVYYAHPSDTRTRIVRRPEESEV